MQNISSDTMVIAYIVVSTTNAQQFPTDISYVIILLQSCLFTSNIVTNIKTIKKCAVLF